MNYAIEQRLRLIDFLLYHYKSINRAMLIDFFGISPAAATRDFSLYAEKAPNNMLFNASTKCWTKSDSFQRLFEGEPCES